MKRILITSQKKSTSINHKFNIMISQIVRLFDKIMYKEIVDGNNPCRRFRIFNLLEFIKSCVLMCYSNVQNISIALATDNYAQQIDHDITPQAIRKQLMKSSTLETIIKFTDAVVKKAAWMEVLDNKLQKLFDLLHEKLGITSFIGIDGTCLSVAPGCRETMGASSMGQPKKDGTVKAFIKAHIGQSITNIIYSFILTGTAGKGTGERAQVLPEMSWKSLLVMDAGYQSEQIFQLIQANAGYFLIRAKENVKGFVTEVISDLYNGVEAVLKIKELSKIRPRIGEVIDVIVRLSGGTYVRVVKYAIDEALSRRGSKKNRKKKKRKIITLITNLPSSKISADSIELLYKIRWRMCEIGNKCLKSGNSFNAVKSCDERIVKAFFCFSLIAYCLKNMQASIMKQICKDKELCHELVETKIISPLKLHCHKSFVLEALTKSLLYNPDEFSKSIIAKAELIYKYFAIDAPSKEDIEHNRSIYVLIDKILEKEDLAA